MGTQVGYLLLKDDKFVDQKTLTSKEYDPLWPKVQETDDIFTSVATSVLLFSSDIFLECDVKLGRKITHDDEWIYLYDKQDLLKILDYLEILAKHTLNSDIIKLHDEEIEYYKELSKKAKDDKDLERVVVSYLEFMNEDSVFDRKYTLHHLRSLYYQVKELLEKDFKHVLMFT